MRKVQMAIPVNENVVSTVDVDVTLPAAMSAGTVLASGVEVREVGSESIHSTILKLTNVPVTVRDTEQGGGVDLYMFPRGKIIRLGAAANLSFTTSSDVDTTLNASKTCQFGLGSATQTNTTLATTEQDIVQVTAFTSSAETDVASAEVKGYGVGTFTLLDGASTLIHMYLNVAVAGAGDIDLDATVLVNGSIVVNWICLGQRPWDWADTTE
jgi:hypothetical protein